jgi:carboxymethylenebutenolidase
MVAENDSNLAVERPRFAGPAGELTGYLARPAEAGRRPAVLVIHENTGLNAHIEDVTRRFAREGFMAFALDALALQGGTPSDEDRARSLIGDLDSQDNLANYVASLDFLRNRPDATGKVGCVGFCWGGRIAAELAIADEHLDAAVVYYGKSPDSAEVPKIVAPLLLHYGERDERINATVPAFQQALEGSNKRFSLNMYQGAGHAFNNDSRPDRYEPQAAAESWERTTAFLSSELALGQ